MHLTLDWPPVDHRRARLSEGSCPGRGHPRLVLLDGEATCPQGGLAWRLNGTTVTVPG